MLKEEVLFSGKFYTETAHMCRKNTTIQGPIDILGMPETDLSLMIN